MPERQLTGLAKDQTDGDREHGEQARRRHDAHVVEVLVGERPDEKDEDEDHLGDGAVASPVEPG